MAKRLGVLDDRINKQIGTGLAKRIIRCGVSKTVRLDEVRPNTGNYRKAGHFTLEEVQAHLAGNVDWSKDPERKDAWERLVSLTNILKKRGMLQSVVVEADGTGYKVIAGDRRYLAHHLAGETHIHITVYPSGSEKERKVLSLIENVSRENPSLYDTIEGVRELCGPKTSAAELKEELGISLRQCQRFLRYVDMPPAIMEKVRNGVIGSQRELDAALKAYDNADKEEEPKPPSKAARAGRKRTAVTLSPKIKVKDPHIVKRVAHRIANVVPSLEDDALDEVDWDDLDQAQAAWDALLAGLLAADSENSQ